MYICYPECDNDLSAAYKHKKSDNHNSEIMMIDMIMAPHYDINIFQCNSLKTNF